MTDLTPLDNVLSVLLETWAHRYRFTLDRKRAELKLNVPGFELIATEAGPDKVMLLFEEAGMKHGVECSIDEAPKVIEALLFPPPPK